MDWNIIAPTIVFISIAMLLTHFLNDADALRGFCEGLHIKYLLTKNGPQDYLDKTSQNSIEQVNLKSQLLEDYIVFRSMKPIFGGVNLIVCFGLGLMIGILVTGIGYLCISGKTLFIFPLLILSSYFVFLQITYAYQSYDTFRRIWEIENISIGMKGTFEVQCKGIIGGEVEDMEGRILTKLTRFNMKIYRSKLGPAWSSMVIDVFLLGILGIPIITMCL
jgi:hypothetical protein